MANYLLISPLVETPNDGFTTERWAANNAGDRALRNRIDTRGERLRHIERELVGEDSVWRPPNVREELSIAFGPASELRNGRSSLVVAWASADATQAGNSQELELALSHAMEAFVLEKIGTTSRVRWVSRTLLLNREEPQPQDWFVGQTSELQVPLNNGPSDGAAVNSIITVGWANNMVSNYHFFNVEDKKTLVHGLVDAQVIWTEAEQLSEDSLSELNAHAVRLGFPGSHAVDRKKHKNLLMSLSMHNVTYDELFTGIQGHRREIAQSSLNMWQYPELMKRISRQVTEVARLDEEHIAEQRTKYENLVSNVLLVVGLVSAAQLVLAIIQTAYSGGVDSIPGGNHENGLMDYFRSTSIDMWIWGSLITTVSVFFILSLLRRSIR